MKIDISKYSNKKDLFSFLVNEKELIFNAKKSEIKRADSVFGLVQEDNNDSIVKAHATIAEDVTSIKVSAIINTTNVIDSHQDLHINSIWSKSLKENSRILHLQEHKNQFDKIISSGKDLKARTKTGNFADFGMNLQGTTQALIFDSIVKQARNGFMFDQYKNGHVNEHSVGMQYMKMTLAISDSEFKEEFREWEKYYDRIANKEVAESLGFFFAVQEAKVIEGSAVTLGSNQFTPTQNIEPHKSTQHNEPSADTHNQLIKHLLTN